MKRCHLPRELSFSNAQFGATGYAKTNYLPSPNRLASAMFDSCRPLARADGWPTCVASASGSFGHASATMTDTDVTHGAPARRPALPPPAVLLRLAYRRLMFGIQETRYHGNAQSQRAPTKAARRAEARATRVQRAFEISTIELTADPQAWLRPSDRDGH
jgi:hypothetical protein